MLAFGISTALLHRERHGEGQKDLGRAVSTIPRDGEAIRSGKSPDRLWQSTLSAGDRNYKGSDSRYFFAACFTEKF